MKNTTGRGLPPLSDEMRVQESLLNTLSAQRRPPEKEASVTSVTRQQSRWWKKMDAYYIKLAAGEQRLKERDLRRGYLCDKIGADREIAPRGAYCCLPKFPQGEKRANWTRKQKGTKRQKWTSELPEASRNRYLSGQALDKGEFDCYLSDMTGIEEFYESIYNPRKRPEQEGVEKLFRGLELAEQDRVDFFGQFGRYPLSRPDWWDYLCFLLGADRQDIPSGKFCRLPQFPEGTAPDKWSSGQVLSRKEFDHYLAALTGVSKAKLFDSIYAVGEALAPELARKLEDPQTRHREFLDRFGRPPYPVELFLENIKAQLQTGNSDEHIARCLGVSKNTIGNMKTKTVKQSNAFRINIVAGPGKDKAWEEQLYHSFGLHPLPEGAADGMVTLCKEAYGPVMEARRRQYCKEDPKIREEAASSDFWLSMKTLLKFFDGKSTYNLCGQFFPQPKEDGEDIMEPEEAKEYWEA